MTPPTDYSYDAILEENRKLRKANRALRDGTRSLLRQLCGAVAAQLELRAELMRLQRELDPMASRIAPPTRQ